MIITVHKCHAQGFTYYKKESSAICLYCTRHGEVHDYMLEEETVDKINDKVFKKHRYELEIVNDFENFFNPSEKIFVIDKSLRNAPMKYTPSEVGLFTKIPKIY